MTSRGMSSVWKQCKVLMWLPMTITHTTIYYSSRTVGGICQYSWKCWFMSYSRRSVRDERFKTCDHGMVVECASKHWEPSTTTSNFSIWTVPGLEPSFELFELIFGIVDCFTCSTATWRTISAVSSVIRTNLSRMWMDWFREEHAEEEAEYNGDTHVGKSSV